MNLPFDEQFAEKILNVIYSVCTNFLFPINFQEFTIDLCVNHRKLRMTTSWFDHIFNHSHQINELIGTLLFNNDIADNFDIDFDKCTLNCQFHTEMS